MSNTISSGNTQALNYDLLLRSTDDVAKQSKTGAGILSQNSKGVPNAQPQGEAKRLAESLSAFTSNGSSSKVDTSVLLLQVAVSMRDTEVLNQNGKINSDMETKKNQAKEKDAKLEEASKKMAEAEEKKKSGSIIDKIKLAFEWIGAALAIATAAVMIATGVFAPIGAMLVVAAIAAVVMAVDSTVAVANDGMGIAGSIEFEVAKGKGKTDEQARESAAKADMGFRIAVAAVGIVASIASGGASLTGAAKAVASTVTETAKMARVALSISEAVVNIGAAGVDAGRTAVTYQEQTLRAGAKELEGKGKKDEAIMQQLDAMIDQALSRLMAAGDRFNAILDNIMEAVNDRGNTLSRAKFRG